MGLAPEKPIFPTVLLCPFCSQNTLYLFDDVTTENIWLCCQTCNAHGDIITFGSQLWNISLPDTVEKFSQAEAVAPDAVERFSAEYVKISAKHRAAEDFYQEAVGQLWCHGDDLVASRLLKLGVRNEIAGNINFVGVARYDAIERVCAALHRAKPAHPNPRSDGAIVVLPFYDLPGRLTGLFFLQYEKDGSQHTSFVPLAADKVRRPEAGYFMLPQTVWAAPGPMKKTQIITTDIFWALRTQCRRLRRAEPLLPIMATYSGPEAESYGATLKIFLPAERIFTGAVTTPELISRACNAGGYVSTAITDHEALGPSDSKRPLYGVIVARRYAKTWQQALSDVLARVDETAAQAFLRRLSIPPEKLALFFKKMPHALSQDTIDSSLLSLRYADIPGSVISRSAKRNYFVIERDQEWWATGNFSICNAQPVITKIFANDKGERLYAGQIFFKTEKYDFIDSAAKIERAGLLAYAASVLAPHGRLVMFNPAWNRKSHFIAQQLHPPELVHVSTQTGWDETAGVFRFGNYELTAAGKVRVTPTWPTTTSHAHSFPEITPIAPVNIYALLTPSHENAFIWSAFAAFAANLLAPVFYKATFAVSAADTTFDYAAKLGQTINCDIDSTAAPRRREAVDFLRRANLQAGWPTSILNTFDDNYFCACAPKFTFLPALVKMSAAGCVAARSYGWLNLQGSAPTVCRHDVLQYVLPAYIQAALADRTNRFSDALAWPHAVLTHLHQWLQNIYGQTFNLAHAKTQIATADTAHEALLRELIAAVQAGEIDLLPQPRNSKQPKNYLLRQKDTWWLNRRAVNRYFLNKCGLAPNWFGIIDLLQQNNVYHGLKNIYDMPGIDVSAAWVDALCTEKERSVKETG